MTGLAQPYFITLECGLLLLLAVLTTDVALLHDPSYLHWVKTFAEDEGALRHAFQHGECLTTGSLYILSNSVACTP
jgi:hypothetical protein